MRKILARLKVPTDTLRLSVDLTGSKPRLALATVLASGIPAPILPDGLAKRPSYVAVLDALGITRDDLPARDLPVYLPARDRWLGIADADLAEAAKLARNVDSFGDSAKLFGAKDSTGNSAVSTLRPKVAGKGSGAKAGAESDVLMVAIPHAGGEGMHGVLFCWRA